MAANIGSTWTVIGNPQIAFIVSKTGVEFGRYLKHMLFPTVFVLTLHIALLHVSYVMGLFRSTLRRSGSTLVPTSDTDDRDHENHHNHDESAQSIEMQVLETAVDADGNSDTQALTQSTSPNPTPSISSSSIVQKQSNTVWMPVLVSVMMFITVVLLLIPAKFASFDLGLVPFAAGLVVVIADKLFLHNASEHVFSQLDWPVLLLFMGLFVWLQVRPFML
jgi:Na+/H+ antiporter NhaD/arsenite permease-like protein